jgi:hypothetical protein
MTKYAGRGIVISFEGNTIGQLTAFGEPGSTRDLIDASAYGDDWKDYVLGQQDGNEVAGTIAYDPGDTGHEAMIDFYNNNPDDIATVNITHAVAGFDADISCRLTAVSRGGDLGGLLQLSFTLKIVEPGVVDNS